MKLLLTPAHGFLILECPEVTDKKQLTDVSGKVVSSKVAFDGFKVIGVGNGSDFNIGDMVLHNLEKMPTFNAKFEENGEVVHKKAYVITEQDVWAFYGVK
jgi:hypothetical protein